jgi:dipeptidyl aminopeptidase/acylaminoacyl peptidase
MRRSAALLPFVSILLISVPYPLSGQQAHPFTVRDLVAMDRLSEPAASPDGSRVALTISALDLDANRRRSDIWVVGADGSGLRRLTRDPASDTSPVWHRDGRHVFYLSARSGHSQVWKVDTTSGTETQVTKLPLDIGAFKLSPDSTALVVSLEVFVDCDTLSCTTGRLAEKEKTKASGQIYDRLFVRHWDTWSDGRRSHLFVVPVAGGTAVDAMKGMDADAPSKPFGGKDEFSFTPDGSGVVFTARDAGREEAWSTNLGPVRGTGGRQRATQEPDCREPCHGYRTVVLA